MKKCSKCEQLKQVTDFALDSSCKGGRATVCKNCHSTYKRKTAKERDLITDADLVIELCIAPDENI